MYVGMYYLFFKVMSRHVGTGRRTRYEISDRKKEREKRKLGMNIWI